MLTMWPRRRGCIRRSASRQHRNVPTMWTSSMARRSATDAACSGPKLPTPAELTRMSRPGSSANRDRTSASLVTSRPTSIMRPPAIVLGGAASDGAAKRRAKPATSAPSAASARAPASPMPLDAPVTAALLPWNLMMGSLFVPPAASGRLPGGDAGQPAVEVGDGALDLALPALVLVALGLDL